MTTRRSLTASVSMATFATAFAAALLASACSMPEAPTRTALVYGISIYTEAASEGQGGNLTLSDDDAEAVAAMLSDKGWDVTLGVADSATASENEDASWSAIVSDIAALSGTEGLVLFYYSGHGYYKDGESCIIPHDGYGDFSKCIAASELTALFKAAGLSNVVIILDSCYSGGFVDGGSTVDAIPERYGLLDDGQIAYTAFVDSLSDALAAYVSYEADSRYVVLSAAGAADYSWETGTHGVFTGYLLAAGQRSASAADADGDGYVDTTELYAFCAAGIDGTWNAARYDDYSDGQYADFFPHLSGTAREYALWAVE